MPAKTSFEHLLASGRIGPVEIRNRILLSAMRTNLAEPDRRAGERIPRDSEEHARRLRDPRLRCARDRRRERP
jgi:2,4-dienoyl-CoA reductase-like NADH-dependent reductase (Old Yellow Enzyme family)